MTRYGNDRICHFEQSANYQLKLL